MLNFGSSFGKNAKGFTLFTALVGFIVIAIGLLVIQHMNNSEANYNQIIIGMQSQSEMEAIKDFLRLEAFNVFNILLRAKYINILIQTVVQILEMGKY
jgi:competence protein ComGF